MKPYKSRSEMSTWERIKEDWIDIYRYTFGENSDAVNSAFGFLFLILCGCMVVAICVLIIRVIALCS